MYKIGIIIDDITLKAGTERAVINLCRGLRKYHPEISIVIISVFSNHRSPIFFDLAEDVEVIHLNHPNNFGRFTKPIWYLRLVIKLRKVVKLHSFDALLGTTYIHNILLPIVSRDNKIKKIACEHEVYEYPTRSLQKIRKKVYPRLDAVVVLNEVEKEKYSFLKNVVVIPNSLSFHSETTSDLIFTKIIAVGRLTYQKGFDNLIHIMKIVVDKYPDWTLDIYGEGEDREKLTHLIHSEHLQAHVFLKGIVPDISEKYLQSSIFVLPSRWESFGLVLIEAMQVGLPCVAYDCAGPSVLIDNAKNGFLVKREQIQSFADKIGSLIEDKNLRKNMAEEAIKTSKAFDEQNIIPLWIPLFQTNK